MDPSILEYMAEKNWFSVDIQTILEDEGFKKLNPSSKRDVMPVSGRKVMTISNVITRNLKEGVFARVI